MSKSSIAASTHHSGLHMGEFSSNLLECNLISIGIMFPGSCGGSHLGDMIAEYSHLAKVILPLEVLLIIGHISVRAISTHKINEDSEFNVASGDEHNAHAESWVCG